MTDPGFQLDELSIPTAPGRPGWADFEAAAEVAATVEAEGYGSTELALSAAESLPDWLNQAWQPRRLFVARVDGRIVARGVYETLADETPSDAAPADAAPAAEPVAHAWIAVQVLADQRRRGIGTALFDRLEAIAETSSRPNQIVYTVSPDAEGPRLHAPTGFGSVPLGNPEVRFLLGRGYRLEQVVRTSRLVLPADAGAIERLRADAARTSGDEYAVLCWTDRTPAEWLDDLAVLRTRMTTDAPSAGLEEPEDVWTAARVVEEEEAAAGSPRSTFTAVALHRPTGRLVAFTELSVPRETARAVIQEDTLVLREHRGHRLGLLLKAANLQRVERERPGHPSVLTFNAEENRHMLSVNETIGFRSMGQEGAWRRSVADPVSAAAGSAGTGGRTGS